MMCDRLQKYSLYLAWLLALLMTLGSLYASEILQMGVCDLCWFQRVFIYPLAIILGIAAYRQDTGIVIYANSLIVAAIIVAIYQYLMQMIPGFAPIEVCSVGHSCAKADFKWFGFITFPLLTIIAGIILIILLNCARSKPTYNQYIIRN